MDNTIKGLEERVELLRRNLSDAVVEETKAVRRAEELEKKLRESEAARKTLNEGVTLLRQWGIRWRDRALSPDYAGNDHRVRCLSKMVKDRDDQIRDLQDSADAAEIKLLRVHIALGVKDIG